MSSITTNQKIRYSMSRLIRLRDRRSRVVFDKCFATFISHRCIQNYDDSSSPRSRNEERQPHSNIIPLIMYNGHLYMLILAATAPRDGIRLPFRIWGPQAESSRTEQKSIHPSDKSILYPLSSIEDTDESSLASSSAHIQIVIPEG